MTWHSEGGGPRARRDGIGRELRESDATDSGALSDAELSDLLDELESDEAEEFYESGRDVLPSDEPGGEP